MVGDESCDVERRAINAIVALAQHGEHLHLAAMLIGRLLGRRPHVHLLSQNHEKNHLDAR